MCGVPIIWWTVLDPSEEFHVVKFVELAHEAMEKIYAAGQIPIVTGGTGFYIQALLKEVDFDGIARSGTADPETAGRKSSNGGRRGRTVPGTF